MSIMRCHRHDRSYDSDFSEFCPNCEADGIVIEEFPGGFIARFANDDDDRPGTAWGIATTEDQAIDNLLRFA